MPIIFVVDDAQMKPTPLYERLCEEGYHTLSVGDAESALLTLNCIRADLLVVDVERGSQDCTSMLDKLREHPAHRETPVLLVGAGNDEYDHLKESVRNGSIVMRHQPLEDVIDQVRGYVEPLSVPYH